MLRSKVILIIMTGACLLGSAPTGLAQEPPELYLATARAYADAMIKHGRDTYGEVHSPLFAGALDRKKLKAPRDLIDPIEVFGGRTGPWSWSRDPIPCTTRIYIVCSGH